MNTIRDMAKQSLLITDIEPLILQKIVITRKRKNLPTMVKYNQPKNCFIRANIGGKFFVSIFDKSPMPESMRML